MERGRSPEVEGTKGADPASTGGLRLAVRCAIGCVIGDRLSSSEIMGRGVVEASPSCSGRVVGRPELATDRHVGPTGIAIGLPLRNPLALANARLYQF